MLLSTCEMKWVQSGVFMKYAYIHKLSSHRHADAASHSLRFVYRSQHIVILAFKAVHWIRSILILSIRKCSVFVLISIPFVNGGIKYKIIFTVRESLHMEAIYLRKNSTAMKYRLKKIAKSGKRQCYHGTVTFNAKSAFCKKFHTE